MPPTPPAARPRPSPATTSLLVNPLRDGLNLVAMEGPVLNTTDGILALSTEAGAWDAMEGAAIAVDPFDISGTAAALAQALDASPVERADRAKRLKEAAVARTPSDWLDALLAAAGRTQLKRRPVTPEAPARRPVRRRPDRLRGEARQGTSPLSTTTLRA